MESGWLESCATSFSSANKRAHLTAAAAHVARPSLYSAVRLTQYKLYKAVQEGALRAYRRGAQHAFELHFVVPPPRRRTAVRSRSTRGAVRLRRRARAARSHQRRIRRVRLRPAARTSRTPTGQAQFAPRSFSILDGRFSVRSAALV